MTVCTPTWDAQAAGSEQRAPAVGSAATLQTFEESHDIDHSRALEILAAWKDLGTLVRCFSVAPAEYSTRVNFDGFVVGMSEDDVTLQIKDTEDLFLLSLLDCVTSQYEHITVSAIYDKLGRMTQKSFSDSTGTNTGTISFTYDLDNHLTQVTDPNTSSTYAYDVMGRKVSSATEYAQLSSMTFTLGYVYDKNSNRTQMTYPGGETVNYVYDSLNRLSSLTDSEAGAFTFGYDDIARRTSLARPNGVSTGYVYDAGSKVISVTHQGTTVLDGAAYLYNSNANRTQRTDLRTQTVDQFTYDAVNQLVRVDESTPTTDLAVKERFLYDAVGNLLGRDTAVNTYGPSNELLSTPTSTYTYDVNNNLSSVTDSGSLPPTLGTLLGECSAYRDPPQ